MVIPGGSSMPPLKSDEIEGLKMDQESLKNAGSSIGTAGIIVMDESTDVVKVLKRITQFYYHESCGQCTPCREGCGWMLKMLNRIDEGEGKIEDIKLLEDVASNIEGNTICAFGDAAAWPVKYTIQKFRNEFEAKISSEKQVLESKDIVHSLRNERSNYRLQKG
jgi:NADH-quinone oxidoreductase subunit F